MPFPRFLIGAFMLFGVRFCYLPLSAAPISAPLLVAVPPAHTSSAPSSPYPQLVLQTGHDVSADELAVSPDGQWLATGDGVGVVKLWNLRSGDLWWTLPEVNHNADSLLFSPDSRFLAAGRSGSGVQLFEVATGRRAHTLYSQKEAEKFLAFPTAFSPNGRLLWLARHVGLLQARSTSTGTVTKQWKISGRFLAMSNNATLAASIDSEGALHLWDLATGKLKKTLFKRKFVYGHPATTAATFTLDGTRLATGSYEGQIELWDIATGTRVPTTKLNLHIISRPLFGDSPTDSASVVPKAVTSLDFSGDGRTLVAGMGDHPELENAPVSSVFISSTTDLDSGEVETTSLESGGDSIEAVAITPDGRTLVSTDDEATIRLWDARTRRITRTLARAVEEPTSVAFAPDGQSLVTNSQSHPSRLWDLQTGQMAQPLTEKPKYRTHYFGAASTFAFSPDGSYLAIGDYSGSIQLWSGRSRRLVATLHGSAEEITSLAFSRDSRILASGSDDGLVRLWQAQTPTNSRPFSLQRTWRVNDDNFDPVTALSFVSDDGSLATTGKYSYMRLWDATTRRMLRQLPVLAEDSPGAFSSGGRHYAQLGQGKIEVWDLTTGKMQQSIAIEETWISGLAFSPDGHSLAVAVSVPNTLAPGASPSQQEKEHAQLRIWDLRTGKIQKTLRHWPEDAYSLAYSPDGKRLAVCTRQKTVQLWDVAGGQMVVSFAMLPASQDLQLSDNWIAFTPTGDFQVAPGAEAFVRWRVGNTILPFSTYASTHQKPSLLIQALQQPESEQEQKQ